MVVVRLAVQCFPAVVRVDLVDRAVDRHSQVVQHRVVAAGVVLAVDLGVVLRVGRQVDLVVATIKKNINMKRDVRHKQ